MKKIFISIPMHGISKEEVERQIAKARVKLTDMFRDVVEIVDAFDTAEPDKDLYEPRLYYLGNAIEKMAKCDAVAFFGDWSNARGCKIEEEVAKTYFLDRLYFENDN